MEAAGWWWLAIAVVIHQTDYVMLALVYRAGDMGHTYPLMRGMVPLLLALASGPLLGEHLNAVAWTGIGLVCAGILQMGLHRGNSRKATVLALTNAVMISLFTLIDGIGARASTQPISYVLFSTRHCC